MASLLSALMSVSVDDTKAQHGCSGLFCVEYVLDLTFKLEKVILSKIYLLHLKSDCLFNDGFQVLSDFFSSFRLMMILVDVAVVILHFYFILSMVLYSTKFKHKGVKLTCDFLLIVSL